MTDYGSRYADRAISEVNRDLMKTYRTAQKELRQKLSDFNKRFREKDKEKRNQLKEGKISLQDYRNWQSGQVFVKSQWENKIRQVNEVIINHNNQAMRIVNDKTLDVFAENFNQQAYLTEMQIIGTSFDFYNAEAVARLIADDPDLLPRWKTNEKKDYEWNYQKVNNIVKQGIIQGESIEQITERLCKDLSTQNENKMRTFARTAITGAQNAGRQQQMENAAESLHIEVHKKWIATLDNRTRDAHRHLDGQEVPYDENFDSDLGEIAFPGDPSAAPANTYNCRCTLITVYPKYANESSNGARRAYGEYTDEEGNTHRYSYLTVNPGAYEEWKKDKSPLGNDVIQDSIGVSKNTPIDIAEAVLGSNPNYNRKDINDKFNKNCQRCVIAYELRRRGYDVQARERLTVNNRIRYGTECFKIPNGKSPILMYTPAQTVETIKEKLNVADDGSRFFIWGTWTDSNKSHVFIAEKAGGMIYYIDPQNGKMDCENYLSRFVNHDINICKVDDLELTNKKGLIRNAVKANKDE